MRFVCDFKYEFFTSDDQRCALSKNTGCRRFVFNKALKLQNELRKNGFVPLCYKKLSK